MNIIKEKLETQLKLETDAVTLYESFIEKIEDEDIKQKISAIKQSEEYHVKLVEEMLNLFSQVNQEVTSKETNKKIGLEGFQQDYASLLIIDDMETHVLNLIEILKENQKDCIYVSYNKIADYTKKKIEEKGIDTSRIRFLSCIKAERESITANPQSLTDVSMTIEELRQEIKKDHFVIIDAVSGFKVYHEENKILEFVGFMNSKFEPGQGIIWLSIDNQDITQLNNSLSTLTDKVIRI